MKTTAKEYKEKYELRTKINRQLINEEDIDCCSAIVRELKKKVKELDETYFDLLPKVNVSFSIGGRSYYQEAVKIGSKYFEYGESMTKARGYWGIEEIPAITERMTANMISDSYYY